MSETLVARDRAEHAAMAAELLGRAVVSAVAERGVARVALSGAETPRETYRRVAGFALPFEHVAWYWVDERAVPPESPRSNYGAAAQDLELADGKHGRAFRMQGEHDPERGAQAYQALLRRSFGVASAVAFDAMVLGIGDDGHTASLFPGIGAVRIDDRLAAHIRGQPGKGLEARITLTAPVIVEARLILMLVLGKEKLRAVAAARGPGSEDEVPARVLQRAKGRVVWIGDEAALGG